MLESTREFTSVLDENGVSYNMLDPSESGKDVMYVSVNGENMSQIRVLFIFDPDNESAAIHVVSIVKVPADKIAKMFLTVNSLNNRFRFAKFCLDTDDNTVQMEIDVPFRAGSAGSICMEMLARTLSICDKAYPELMKAIWG